MSVRVPALRVVVPFASVALLIAMNAPVHAASTVREAGSPAVGQSTDVAGGGLGVAWGWATARHATTASYTPATRDRGNLFGGGAHIVRSGVGQYTVTFPILGAFPGGIAHVTALGGNRVCNVTQWTTGLGTSTNDLAVGLRCFSRTGSPADSKYVVDYLRAGGTSSLRLAYLWANEPETSDYVPSPAYSFNTYGNVNTVHRDGVGRYVIDFTGLNTAQGHVQLSVYGTAAASCRAVNWLNDAGNTLVKVRCRNFAGALVDTTFDATFMQGLGLKGAATPAAAYLRADQPTAASYHPAGAFRYTTAGRGALVTRGGTGQYAVAIKGMPLGGAALVTGYGDGAIRCVLDSIRTSGTAARIQVRCYGQSGALSNGKFLLTFLR